MEDPDQDLVAPLVASYLHFLRGTGGAHPTQLLARVKTVRQRELLFKGFEDVHLICSLTSLCADAEADACFHPGPSRN